MINFFIVASDPSVIPVFEMAFAAASEVCIEGAWIDDELLKAEIRKRFPGVLLFDHWDQIIANATRNQALLISGTSDSIITAAKQFVHVSKAPVFVLTEQSGPVSELFRLMAVWQEAPQQVVPLFLSGVREAVAIARQKFPGEVQRIEFQRSLGTGTSATVDLNDLDHLLLQDLDWISQFGEFSYVTTLLTAQQESEAIEVTVTLKGENVPEIRWVLSRHSDVSKWQLQLYGAGQKLTLTCQNQTLPQVQIGDQEETLSINNTVESDLLESVKSALDAESGELRSWMDVVRNGEIGAAARRSIDRKRTIPIHFEEASERSQFKSQMTAIGCGVLLWIMFGVIAVLTLASIIDPRDREYRHSASAGFVLTQNEFAEDSPQLKPKGLAHLQQIIEKWSETSPVVLIEATSVDLDLQREALVEEALTEKGLRDVEGKCVVRPLTGKWFERALWLAWGVVFLPLVLVLIAQGLLVVARSET